MGGLDHNQKRSLPFRLICSQTSIKQSQNEKYFREIGVVPGLRDIQAPRLLERWRISWGNEPQRPPENITKPTRERSTSESGGSNSNLGDQRREDNGEGRPQGGCWESKKSVCSWSGQCHRCQPGDGHPTAALDVWLRRRLSRKRSREGYLGPRASRPALSRKE